ncbi:MAG: glycine cleavage system protein H [Thermoplasmata archaeon]|nr:MAG: glycine cleavage system protein H [Thermoplasmata archaeon]
MDVEGFELKEDLYYESSGAYIWAKVEGDIVTVGITPVGVAVAKDFVYLELPSEGDSVTQGEAFGVIETIKATGELISPVSGEVVEVNEEAQDDPASIKENPYDKWLIKIKATNLEEELKNLMDIEKAKDWYIEEIRKLREDGILE